MEYVLKLDLDQNYYAFKNNMSQIHNIKIVNNTYICAIHTQLMNAINTINELVSNRYMLSFYL